MDEFDRFWLAFPRRVAKQAAKRMYARALKLTTADNILRGAERYARERRGENPQFTKHPATWLNGGCWDDEPAQCATTRGGSVLDAFERLEQQLSGDNDSQARENGFCRLPPR